MDHVAGMSRRAKAGHYALLAALCVLLFALINSYLVLQGYGLLWKTDGISLYYAYFVYEGKLLRNIGRAIMSGKLPQIPAYSFSEGYGADTFITMSSSLFDPFNLIAVFFPTKYAEYGFCLGMLLRLIFTSWTFSAYCFHRKKDSTAALIGSLCYVTCGFILRLGLHRHPKFLYFPLWLPLMFIEADKLFDGKRGWLLSVWIAFAFAFTPLFTYMTCFMMLGYCLIKYLFAPRERSIKDFFLLVLSFIARLFLGFAMGAVVALPVIIEMLSESRVTAGGVVVPALYSIKYYMSLASNIVGTSASALTLYAGIVPCFMLVVFVVGHKHVAPHERTSWLVGLLVVLVMLVVPWFGSMFNGFNYVTDRWMPVTSFCFAYIVTLSVPVIGELERKEWIATAVLSALLLLVCSGLSLFNNGWQSLLRILPLFCCLVPLLMMGGLSKRQMATLLAALVIIPAGYHMTLLTSPAGDGYADEFISRGTAWKVLAGSTPADTMKDVGIEEGYRYSQPGIYNASHGALALDLPGLDYCVGIYGQPVNDFRIGLELANNRNIQRWSGNDGRLALDLLSGAKYFVASKGTAYRVPYSYKKTDTTKHGFTVYETEAALPVAFTYETAVSLADYDLMDPLTRQEALLAGCVLEDPDGLELVSPEGSASTCKYTIKASDDVLLEDHAITTASGGKSITITPECLPKCETYLRITDLRFDGKNLQETAQIFDQDLDQTPVEKFEDDLYSDPSEATISIKTELGSRSLRFPLPGDHVWTGRDDWCFNLGYSEEPIESIKVTFKNRGTYTYRDLEVISQPVKPLLQQAKALQPGGATEVSFGINSLSATLNTDKDGELAFFSVPYSKGWSATVDGQKAEIVQANVGFMGVKLGQAGAHQVELHYRTPGLLVGGCVTLAAIVACCVLSVRARHNDESLPPKRSTHMAME